MLMTLAGIQSYVFVWQLWFLLAYVCVWMVAGTYLTRWALQRYAELPRSKATVARSFRVNFLSGAAAHLAALTVLGFFTAFAFRGERWWVFVGAALAPVAMLGMSWLVQMNVLSATPRVLGRMLCATTVPLVVLLSLLGVGTAVKARQAHMTNVALDRCLRNQRNLDKYLGNWLRRNLGKPAPTLETIVDEVNVYTRQLQCPGSDMDRPGYLYNSTPNEDDPQSKKIRLVDRRGNHDNVRILIFANGRSGRVSEEEFQAMLKLPENATIRRLDEQDK